MVRVLLTACIAALALNLSPAAADIADTGRIMLVLDSSGSMKEAADGGQTKIAAAKQALGDVISSLPAEQVVGLRVYGAKVFSRSDAGACQDSQEVVQLGTDNRDALRQAVAQYKPYGETPIGYALQQAANDLGGEGQRTIVLVSDGEPTCDPDPCKVAKDLSKTGIDLKIDVVGLDVSGSARDKLRCVAESGNGTYYDADDAKSLTDSLTTTSVRASRPFDLTGTPIKGTAAAADAPFLTTGVYLDTFGADDGLWYKVQRSAPNSTLHVGITHRSPDTGNFGDKAYVGVYAGPDQDRCDYETSFARGNIAYTSANSWKRSADDPCNTAETLWVNVKQASTRRDFTGDPVEIAVYEEPPLSDPSGTDLPAMPDKPTWTTLSPGSPTTAIVPGTSISNAPVVTDGTYAFDLVPGETQVVAVPLDWGQNLQAQLDATLTDATLTDELRQSSFDGPWVQVLGPIRQAIDTDEYGTSTQPPDWTSRTSDLSKGLTDYRTGSQSYTIGYQNRAESESHLSGSSLPGLRYVQVSYPAKNDAPIAYTLTLSTNGTAGEGAPSYATVDDLAAPTADSTLVSGISGPGGTSASAPSRSREPSAAQDDGLALLPVGLGVGGVVLIAAAYLLLRRARAAG